VAAESSNPSSSLTSAALSGSFANSAQWVLNKCAVAISTLVVARYVTADDYGLATQAFSIAIAVALLSPGPMGDVLLAHPRSFRALAPAAWQLSVVVAVSMCALTLVSIPLALGMFTKYPASGLALLLVALACKPIFDALLVVPIARLRLDLRFRRLAVTDGLCQLGATIATTVLAIAGAGAAAVVLPQVAVPIARFAALWKVIGGIGPVRGHRAKVLRRFLVRSFVPATLAQYVHNVLVVLEILVLGLVSGDYQTGLFGFGFAVAAQANAVIAYQLGQVLQPIFSRLRDEPHRQVAGLMRAQRVLAAVCVPIALLQAALAPPIFRLLFPKWEPAIAVFQAISVGQAFYFSTGPSMSCLRAQRRFAVLFLWQAAQLLLSVPLFWLAASAGHAFAVAVASCCAWGISSPTALLLCSSGVKGDNLREITLLFTRPWMCAGPIALAAWWIADSSKSFGAIADVGAVVVVGPMALVASLTIMRWRDPVFAEASERLLWYLRARFKGRRRESASSSQLKEL
jgi:O-antigen/teichoic acid export membrane protein